MHLQDREDIFAARPAIEALCQDLCEANVFFEPWFLFPALHHLGAGDGVTFLCFREQDDRQRLCGFLPLIETRIHPFLPLTIQQVWSHRQCFRCTPLVRKGFAEAFWNALLSWLESRPWSRSLLDLQHLAGDGELWGALQSALRKRPAFHSLVYRFDTAFLTVDQGYEATLRRSMSNSTRRKLKQQLTRLGKLGKVEFTDIEAGHPIDGVIDEFLQIEAAGWKGKAGTALASDEREVAVFRDVMRAAHELGRLTFLALRLDGRMIAAQCVIQAAPGSFQFKTAYDESFSKFSPGVQLEMEEMRRTFEPADPLRARLAWSDSCAGPNNGPNYRCWPDRRPIVRCRIAGAGTLYALAFKVWPLVQPLLSRVPQDEGHYVKERLSGG